MKNAVITSTKLGFEHGVLTFSICVEYGDGGGQCMGGYVLHNSHFPNKDIGGRLIHRLLGIVKVDAWEYLKGEPIRVTIGPDKTIDGMYNFLEDDGVYFREFFKNLAEEIK